MSSTLAPEPNVQAPAVSADAGQTNVPAPRQQESKPRSNKRAIFTGGIGNGIEFYDWSIYAFLAPFIAVAFFPNTSTIVALLSAFAVFAVGFIARPIGGYVLGKIADRRGRKFALTLSVFIMSVSCVAIALTPSAAAIGIAATIILVVCRLIQGFSLGGELPSAVSYMTGQAPKGRVGRYISFYSLGAAVGALFGAILCFALTAGLGQETMQSWGWRIPFLVAGLLAVIAFFVRRHAPEENPEQSKGEYKNSPLRDLWNNHRPAVILMMVLAAVFATAYTTLVTAFPAIATEMGADPKKAFLATAVGQILCLILLPIFGEISDRFGSKRTLILGLAASGASIIPLFMWLQASPASVLPIAALSMIPACMVGITVFSFMAPRFPAHLRAVAIGTAYTIPACIFAGTAPLIVTALIGAGSFVLFGAYVFALAVIAIIVVAVLARKTVVYKD